MSAYTAAAGVFEPLDGIRFRVLQPFSWDVGKVGSDWTFTVAAGTVFDVSIPWFLRWAFDPRDRRLLKAAALHDEMLGQGFDRLTAAAVFNEALKADRVGPARRFAMTAAVAFWRWE